MSAYDYDLFVIGGGSGGVRAARVAAALGKKVGIAEEYRFGSFPNISRTRLAMAGPCRRQASTGRP